MNRASALVLSSLLFAAPSSALARPAPAAPPPPAPASAPDQDADGVPDADDLCPATWGLRSDGCMETAAPSAAPAPAAPAAAMSPEAARAQFATLLSHRDSPDYIVSDAKFLPLLDQVRVTDPALVTQAKALLADRQRSLDAVSQARAEADAAGGKGVSDAAIERLLYAKVALIDAEKADTELRARIGQALHAVLDASVP